MVYRKEIFRAFDKKGFTLIEMLVVVAIIGILAALMMPGLQSAITSARSLSCANNRKQVYSCFVMYEGEWNVIPPWEATRVLSNFSSGDPWSTKGSIFWNFLGIYAGHENWNWSYPNGPGAVKAEVPGTIFNCPEYDMAWSNYSRYGVGTGMTIFLEPAYSMSVELGVVLWNHQQFGKISKNPRPGEKIFVSDAGTQDKATPGLGYAWALAQWEANPDVRNFGLDRHKYSPNILFFDGHNKPFNAASIIENVKDDGFFIK